jgi:uncharacterized phage protein gp47/JayE
MEGNLMAFIRPTLLQIVNRIVSDLNARVDNSTTFLRRSVFMILARVLGGAIHLIYGFLDFMKRQLFISTADSEFLTLHGNEFGKTRKAGSKATGSGGVIGTNGIIIPVDTKLQSETGNLYTTDVAVTIVGGIGTLSFIAEEQGDSYNEPAGITLTFVSPIAGVNTSVLVGASGIIGGVDDETDDEYRNRLLSRKRQPPHGGTDFDYVDWALEVSGVTRAWCIPLYQGVGTVGLAFVRDNDTDIIPTEAQRLAVYNYILSHTDPVSSFTIGIPVTATPGFFVIPVTALTVNFNILLNPNTTVIQASVTSRLQDLFKTRGGAGETITISQMYEAIVSAVGEVRSRIVLPAADVAANVNQVHVLGDISFGEYS